MDGELLNYYLLQLLEQQEEVNKMLFLLSPSEVINVSFGFPETWTFTAFFPR